MGPDNPGETKPLIQIIPTPGDRAATLRIAAVDLDRKFIGTEGSLVFLMAKTPDGVPVLDRMIKTQGGEQRLDIGSYTFVAYVRPCDGNCSLLDPAMQICSIEGMLEAETTYLLAVHTDACTLEVQPAAT